MSDVKKHQSKTLHYDPVTKRFTWTIKERGEIGREGEFKGERSTTEFQHFKPADFLAAQKLAVRQETEVLKLISDAEERLANMPDFSKDADLLKYRQHFNKLQKIIQREGVQAKMESQKERTQLQAQLEKANDHLGKLRLQLNEINKAIATAKVADPETFKDLLSEQESSGVQHE